MPSAATLNIYRRRVKMSACRGLRARSCNKKAKCKHANGTMRKFCRKRKNGLMQTL